VYLAKIRTADKAEDGTALLFACARPYADKCVLQRVLCADRSGRRQIYRARCPELAGAGKLRAQNFAAAHAERIANRLREIQRRATASATDAASIVATDTSNARMDTETETATMVSVPAECG
jgi:hypothetical protein